MANQNTKIQQRLKNMKNFYLKADELIDKLPDVIPNKTKNMIKDVLLGDDELKRFMESIDSHRPPRLFLIGRTGVGKSSLINALCGAYVAKVSDTKSCTESADVYQIIDEGRVLMEILDTRGTAESVSLNTDVSAETLLARQINEFSPDVAIMMLNCMHRDDIVSDIEFMKTIASNYKSINSIRIPIVVVVNKCDDMAPAREKTPDNYPQRKIEKIEEQVKHYKEVIDRNGLDFDHIVPVASLIDWQTKDGEELAVEDIDNLSKKDIADLEIAFDGRYRINELLDVLEEVIQDSEAQMGLRMAARLEEVVKRFSKQLTKSFVSISMTVAISPIPVADLYVLVLLQCLLVSLIAALSGRDLSLEAAEEFILSVGGVTGLGFGFRTLAQQGSKALNILFPGAGSAVSSIVAGSGTYAIGQAAIAYFIDGKDLDTARKAFNRFVNR